MRSVDFCIELQWYRFLNYSYLTFIGTKFQLNFI